MMSPARPLQAAAPTRIPLFLAPAFAESTIAPSLAVRCFSSTPCSLRDGTGKDKNKRRGVSAMRSTGFRHKLTIENHYKSGLPTPRPEHERPLDEFPTNPNHGLYGFFNEKKETVVPGEQEEDHGRSWTYDELLFKSFDDLHALYWQCLLEQNRVATRHLEHRRLRLGYGATEIQDRLATVRRSMYMVRKVLLDRQTAYEKAQLLRETKTIRELLGESKPVYGRVERDAQLPSSTSATEHPASTHPPESQHQTSTPEVKRRSLLGR